MPGTRGKRDRLFQEWTQHSGLPEEAVPNLEAEIEPEAETGRGRYSLPGGGFRLPGAPDNFWIVVLLGLEVAFTHQYFLPLLRSRVIRGGPEGDRVGTGLRLFTLVAQRFSAGDDPPTCDQLSRRLLVPLDSVEERVRRLEEVNLLRRVVLGNEGEGVVPARPPREVMVSEVIAAFQPQLMDPGPNRVVEEAVNELMGSFLKAGHDELADLSFGAVLDSVGVGRRE